MIGKKLLVSAMHYISGMPANMKRGLFAQTLPESVFFYTFHKCASTLFSGYILKNIEGLQHVDYAGALCSGKKVGKIKFKERGVVYGPIRLSADKRDMVYKRLVAPASTHDFVRDRIAIFFVRDPRDILVSAYYSYGYTHELSPVLELREIQESLRAKIQKESLDEYVLDSASAVSAHFEELYNLSRACERGVVLRYEDMISDFDAFIAQLCKYVVIDESCISEIYRRSRPKKTEDLSSHRRSGQIGDFRDKLKEETILSLNEILNTTLVRFGYEA
jgi:hypothetical protein